MPAMPARTCGSATHGFPMTLWLQDHSVVRPVGPQGARIELLWHQMIVTATVVFVVVIAALLYAAFRRRGLETEAVIPRDGPARRVIAGAVGISLCILILV